MKNIYLIFISLLSILTGYSQISITGKVLDLETKLPLAFANIIFNNDFKFQIMTDFDGKFIYNSKFEIKNLVCSYVGYEKVVMNISKESMIIYLKPNTISLLEVLVLQNENPANKIIRKVVLNKKTNNPDNYQSYQYTAYNKNVYDLFFNTNSKKDSVEVDTFLKGGHLFITESVSQKKHIKPNVSEETIIASKASGFKNPRFASIETDMQPFSFYNENIKLLNINYLNPISNGCLKKYTFKLEDEIYKEKDTVFIISFTPKKFKNFNGLKGLLYINSNQYAIQNVIASPDESGLIDIKIHQQYQFIDSKYWFPERLNYELVVGKERNSKKKGIIVNGKSYIKNVFINLNLDKNDFSTINLFLDENAQKKRPIYWEKARIEKLNKSEQTTYKIIDSIGYKNNFDNIMNLVINGSQGRFSTTYFDLDLTKSLIINKYEGYRLGTGIFTNNLYSGSFCLGGSLGYGIKDKSMKYTASAFYEISNKKEIYFGYEFNEDLIERGFSGLQANSNLFDIRKTIGYEFNKIKEHKIKCMGKNFKYLNWEFEFGKAKINPISIANSNDSYINTSLSAKFRYAFNEKTTNSFGKKISLATDFPIFELYFSKGFGNFLNGNLNYEKLQIAVNQSVFFKNFGKTDYCLALGLITKKVPFALLFTGEGGYNGNQFFDFYSKNYFQTMSPYEFVSDQFLNLFLNHDFGGLLFKTKAFRPNLIFQNNFSWGNVSANNSQQTVLFKTKNKIFAETGLQINNLIKFKMENLGYFGFGMGVFYRYGYYSATITEQNWVAKLTINYSIN